MLGFFKKSSSTDVGSEIDKLDLSSRPFTKALAYKTIVVYRRIYDETTKLLPTEPPHALPTGLDDLIEIGVKLLSLQLLRDALEKIERSGDLLYFPQRTMAKDAPIYVIFLLFTASCMQLRVAEEGCRHSFVQLARDLPSRAFLGWPPDQIRANNEAGIRAYHAMVHIQSPELDEWRTQVSLAVAIYLRQAVTTDSTTKNIDTAAVFGELLLQLISAHP